MKPISQLNSKHVLREKNGCLITFYFQPLDKTELTLTISATLIARILTKRYGNFASPQESLCFIILCFFRQQCELLLWSCLTPTAHIRIGDFVTRILGWIAQRKTRYIDYNILWTTRLFLCLDHQISHIAGFMDPHTLRWLAQWLAPCLIARRSCV